MKPILPKVAFTIFGIPVMWYGILIGLGMLAGSYVGLKEAKRKGIKEEDLTDMLFYILPMAIIGARLYFIIFNWDYYGKNLNQIINIREGGLAIHGGIILSVIVAYIFCKKRKISFSKMADIAAPGLALGQAIGRWGNFINEEAYGVETSLPWGVIIDGKKHHPTFLYESIGNILIFIFLLYYARKKQKQGEDGKIFSLYMIFYGTIRFFIEGLRTDSLMFFNLRIAQIVSIIFVLLGIIFILIQKKSNKNI